MQETHDKKQADKKRIEQELEKEKEKLANMLKFSGMTGLAWFGFVVFLYYISVSYNESTLAWICVAVALIMAGMSIASFQERISDNTPLKQKIAELQRQLQAAEQNSGAAENRDSTTSKVKKHHIQA